MKKLILLFSLCLFSRYSFADLTDHTVGRASKEDAAQIIAHFKQFDEDDERNLVRYPDEILEDVIESNIKKGRIFVLKSPTGEVVSFLKLHIVEDGEKEDILEGELHLTMKEKRKKQRSYLLDKESREKTTGNSPSFLLHDNQTVVYYGMAYTPLNYRGQGANSMLLNGALQMLQEEVESHMKEHKSTEVAFVFGQVNAAKKNPTPRFYFRNSLLMPLLEKLQRLEEDQENYRCVHFSSFEAQKPTLSFKEGKIEVKFETPGRARLMDYYL